MSKYGLNFSEVRNYDVRFIQFISFQQQINKNNTIMAMHCSVSTTYFAMDILPAGHGGARDGGQTRTERGNQLFQL